MNKDLKYVLFFTAATILSVLATSVFLSLGYESNTNNTNNADSYTVNTSEIKTANGHVLICKYKEDENFAYIIGCFQTDK